VCCRERVECKRKKPHKTWNRHTVMSYQWDEYKEIVVEAIQWWWWFGWSVGGDGVIYGGVKGVRWCRSVWSDFGGCRCATYLSSTITPPSTNSRIVCHRKDRDGCGCSCQWPCNFRFYLIW